MGKSDDADMGDAFGMDARKNGRYWSDSAVAKAPSKQAGDRLGSPRPNKKPARKPLPKRTCWWSIATSVPLRPRTRRSTNFLDANGIQQLRQRSPNKLSAKNTVTKRAWSAQAIEISVEATPAQIEATLAGSGGPARNVSVGLRRIAAERFVGRDSARPIRCRRAGTVKEGRRRFGFSVQAGRPCPVELSQTRSLLFTLEGRSAKRRRNRKGQSSSHSITGSGDRAETSDRPKTERESNELPKALNPEKAVPKGSNWNKEGAKFKDAAKEPSPEIPAEDRRIVKKRTGKEGQSGSPGSAAANSRNRRGRGEPARREFSTQGNQQARPILQRTLQAASKQRVLFVLHVAGGDRPPVAASKIPAENLRDRERADMNQVPAPATESPAPPPAQSPPPKE